MASSSVEIANNALTKLGANRISSLTQDNERARAMNARYEGVRRSLLRKYPWSFAIRRASVAALSDQTAWGELNQFPVPSDFLRLLLNKEIDFLDIRHDWTLEHSENGTVIVTNDAAPLKFRYIADVTDTSRFDPLFDEAFASQLALEACERITGSNTKKADLREEVKDYVNQARMVQSIEKGAQQHAQSPWLDARV